MLAGGAEAAFQQSPKNVLHKCSHCLQPAQAFSSHSRTGGGLGGQAAGPRLHLLEARGPVSGVFPTALCICKISLPTHTVHFQ